MQIPEISVSAATNTVITQLRPAPRPAGCGRLLPWKEWTARAIMKELVNEIKSLGEENLQKTLGRDISHGHKG